jgi:hypothetical protein
VAFPAICALLALFKPDGLWFLISREGAYATFFFPMTYLAFGMLLFQDDKSLDMLHAGIVALFFLASLAIRLRFGGAAAWQGIPMFMVALFISIVISIGFLFGPDKKISTTVACVAGLATIMIPWKFDGNPSVLEAHEVISKYNRGRLPKIFWPKSQIRTKGPTFELITASFTERAWWQRGEKFPDCHQTDGGQIDHDDLLVFLSRETITADELSRFKECSGDFHVLGSTILKDRIGNYQLVLAEMPLDGEIVVLNKHARDLLSETGVIQGTFRYAEDKTSSEGFLSHGPYLSLSKGKYRLTLTYASDMNLNWWDAVFYKKNKWIQMGKNILPNTNGRPEDISVEIEIADAVKPFEVRSYYSGHGRFEVHKLSIVKLGI